jgi:hypothetical protein
VLGVELCRDAPALTEREGKCGQGRLTHKRSMATSLYSADSCT